MSTPNDSTTSLNPLDAIIAGYMMGVEAGEVPNRQETLDRHPDHAEALRAFFADLDHMDRVASPLRVVEGLDETNEVGPNGKAQPSAVRYFGDYELLEEVARGGMGVVYKARQDSLNRIVALKMILAGTFATDRDIARFRAEAEAAANLDHPHIVPIHEVGDYEGRQYYAMKFVEGTSLAKYPQGTPRQEVEGLLDVIRAVHHAHQRGVLHRDLKPSNILVDPNGRQFVTDFGLAKRLGDSNVSLTETGEVIGTARYMAPEQADGRNNLTIEADIYSLGVILYERLTGQTPFPGVNALIILRQVRETEPPRPSTIKPGLDRDLETIVLKCLDKSPLRRYSTAAALVEDLENWLAGRPITARPVRQAERAWRWCRRNPSVSGLASGVVGLLLLVVVGLGLYTAQIRRQAVIEREKAIKDGISATKRELVNIRIGLQGKEFTNSSLPILMYALAFKRAPNHPQADDLRWFIASNLALLVQEQRSFWPFEGEDDHVEISKKHKYRVETNRMNLSGDLSTLVRQSPDGTIQVWDTLTRRRKATIRTDHHNPMDLQLNDNGSYLAIHNKSDQLASSDYVSAVSFPYWGDLKLDEVKSTKDQGALTFWDTTTGQLIFSLNEPTNIVGKFAGSGDRYLTQGQDNHESTAKVLLWDVSKHGRLISEHPGFRLWSPLRIFWGGQQSPDGRFVLLFDYYKHSLGILDTTIGKLCVIDFEPDWVAFSHSGKEVATLRMVKNAKDAKDPKAYVYSNQKLILSFHDTQTGQQIRSNVSFDPSFYPSDSDFKYTQNDKYIIAMDYMYSLATGRKLSIFGRPSTFSLCNDWRFSRGSSVAISTDGQRAVNYSTLQFLPNPGGRSIHPAAEEHLLLGRLFDSGPSLWDVRSNMRFYRNFTDDDTFHQIDYHEFRTIKTEFREDLHVSRKNDYLEVLPRKPFTMDPDVIEIWAEVLTRSRLVEEYGDYKKVPLTEGEWEERRQRLIESLPHSPSPFLTTVAHDRTFWLREEAKISRREISGQLLIDPSWFYWLRSQEPTLETRIELLNRIVALEPKWFYFHIRGLIQGQLKNWDAAASDFRLAAQTTGDWYWRCERGIFMSDVMDRLNVAADPKQLLVDELKMSPETAAILLRGLQLKKPDTAGTIETPR